MEGGLCPLLIWLDSMFAGDILAQPGQQEQASFSSVLRDGPKWVTNVASMMHTGMTWFFCSQAPSEEQLLTLFKVLLRLLQSSLSTS